VSNRYSNNNLKYWEHSLLHFSLLVFVFQGMASFSFLLHPGNTNWRERLSTVDLRALTCLVLILCLIKLYLLFKQNELRVEVNCIEPSPSVSIPCSVSTASVSFLWLKNQGSNLLNFTYCNLLSK
jgi:hypothetical protein